METSQVQLSEASQSDSAPHRMSVIAIPQDDTPIVKDEGGTNINTTHDEKEQPKFDALPTINRHLRELLVIARDTFQSGKSRTRLIDDYMRLQSRINKFFSTTKEQGYDFFAQYAYQYCLSMKALVQVIEPSLRPYPEHQFLPMEWPASELSEDEEELAMEAASMRIDRLLGWS